jgi:hypothetical protein
LHKAPIAEECDATTAPHSPAAGYHPIILKVKQLQINTAGLRFYTGKVVAAQSFTTFANNYGYTYSETKLM